MSIKLERVLKFYRDEPSNNMAKLVATQINKAVESESFLTLPLSAILNVLDNCETLDSEIVETLLENIVQYQQINIESLLSHIKCDSKLFQKKNMQQNKYEAVIAMVESQNYKLQILENSLNDLKTNFESFRSYTSEALAKVDISKMKNYVDKISHDLTSRIDQQEKEFREQLLTMRRDLDSGNGILEEKSSNIQSEIDDMNLKMKELNSKFETASVAAEKFSKLEDQIVHLHNSIDDIMNNNAEIRFSLEEEIRRLHNDSALSSPPMKPTKLNYDIHDACKKGDIESVRWLIFQNMELVNKRANNGDSPIIKAALNGHLELCEYLLVNGADINDSNSHGWTALHYAANNGYKDICEFLIQNGADINAKSKYGKRPLGLSMSFNHVDVTEYLQSKGALQ